MALTPFPSSIGRGSNPRPSNREPSTILLDHSFHFRSLKIAMNSVAFVIDLNHCSKPFFHIPYKVAHMGQQFLSFYERKKCLKIKVTIFKTLSHIFQL